MFSTINKALINIIPYLPITFIKLFSNRYIAGTTTHNALKTVEKVNEINLSATIDILGEHTKSVDKANKITNEYINLYKQIKSSNLDCNIIDMCTIKSPITKINNNIRKVLSDVSLHEITT